MLYLVLAICASTLVSVCMRLSEKFARSNMVMFSANYAVCLAMSLLFMGGFSGFAVRDGMGTAVALGLFSGLLYLLSLMATQTNIRLNGVILSSATMKLGAVLIPILLAIVLFQEQMGWSQAAGTVVAVAAILLMSVGKEDAGVGVGGKKYWLLLLFLISGLTDTMANVYDKAGAPELKDQYLFYTFAAAMALSLLMVPVKKQRFHVADVLCGVLIGIPNYFSARFLLLAPGSIPAVITYPVFSVGTIVAVTAVGLLFFRERLGKQKIFALALILAALVLLNI